MSRESDWHLTLFLANGNGYREIGRDGPPYGMFSPIEVKVQRHGDPGGTRFDPDEYVFLQTKRMQDALLDAGHDNCPDYEGSLTFDAMDEADIVTTEMPEAGSILFYSDGPGHTGSPVYPTKREEQEIVEKASQLALLGLAAEMNVANRGYWQELEERARDVHPGHVIEIRDLAKRAEQAILNIRRRQGDPRHLQLAEIERDRTRFYDNMDVYLRSLEAGQHDA